MAALAFALAALLAGRLPDRGRSFVWLAALAIAVSGAIGFYHAGVELHSLPGPHPVQPAPRPADRPMICWRRSCAGRWSAATTSNGRWLGISMAGWNAILSLACCVGDPMAEPQTTADDRRPTWRPGDARADVAAMLRVDQAGEYGATRIYAGQLAVLGDRHRPPASIARMAAQEKEHLSHFDALLAARGVRPTLLQPFWAVAGHALGAATALIGPEAAMACTAAIEDEIDAHYSEQLAALGDSDPALSASIARFQADEREHRDIALGAGAEQSPAYPLFYSAIRAGCRIAIELSKRI